MAIIECMVCGDSFIQLAMEYQPQVALGFCPNCAKLVPEMSDATIRGFYTSAMARHGMKKGYINILK